MNLPPLPEPKLRFAVEINQLGQRLDYTADQMREYGELCRKQALEEAAQVCADVGQSVRPSTCDHAYQSGANNCVKAIRSLIK